MASADSANGIYRTLFAVPLEIKKRLNELGEPILVETQKDEHQTTRVQYHLPDTYVDQFQSGSIIEFTFTHNPEKVIDYKIISPDGTVTKHVQLAEDKEIQDIPADQFFIRAYWEKDLK